MDLSEVVSAVHRTGLTDPWRLATAASGLARWGPTTAALYAGVAWRHPTRPAVIDDRGSITFRQLDQRSTALAHGFRRLGLAPGQHLGILCRNHRHFVEANLAASKASLRVVYLNTGFAAPQLAEVNRRESVAGLVIDAELAHLAGETGFDGPVVVADGDRDAGRARSIQSVRADGAGRLAPLLARPTQPVLLTSGTTGTPKGAQREGGNVDAGAATGLLQRVPYRAGDTFLIASPLFHAWGLSQLMVAASLGSTVVVSSTFDPEHTLSLVADHEVRVLAVVPVMMQRILAEQVIAADDVATLRIVASSGSALPAHLALGWMDAVGDTLYNLYGSTEVGQATVATPADLRAAPGTAGRVVPGSTVKILDDTGAEVAPGASGRIFVGNGAQFSGYTGGGGKEQIDGLMATGDVGHFEGELLFVTGRADDMIVSGGENVFPAEIEELLAARPEVLEAAVVGVPDDKFGQRLAAFVVPAPGVDLTAKSVKALVGETLARHKVPRDVRFLDELPRNATGKLLRRRLTEMAW